MDKTKSKIIVMSQEEFEKTQRAYYQPTPELDITLSQEIENTINLTTSCKELLIKHNNSTHHLFQGDQYSITINTSEDQQVKKLKSQLFQLEMLRNKELSDWARGIMPYMEDWSKIKFELTDLKKQLDTAEDTLYAIALIMNETEELLPQVIEDNPFMQNVLDELRKYYGEEQ